MEAEKKELPAKDREDEYYFVVEENTVYEVDRSCVERRHRGGNAQKKSTEERSKNL